MWDLIVSVPDHCLSFLLFTDITSSRTLRLYIPLYSHKKIRLVEIIASFSHVKIDCVFNGIVQLSW